MFHLENLFKKEEMITPPFLSKDAIAELLHTSPEALEAFEKAYTKEVLSKDETDNLFDINSRQASARRNCTEAEPTAAGCPDDNVEAIDNLVNRIVDELLAQTPTYIFDGNSGASYHPMALPEGTPSVSKDEMLSLPERLRPELSGNYMKVDIGEPSYRSLLYFYKEALTNSNPKVRKSCYHQFRQGLDILDLDSITYEMIGTNRTSMGHWLPQLVEACRRQEFFKIPATTIVKVPLPLLQLTRLEYNSLSPTTISIVDKWAYKAFQLDEQKEYFIKTGTYSSKFDFRNAHVHGAKEVRELGEYLLFIHFQALCMAHPTVLPHPIYGVSTTNEWVVREYIQDKENNPCIYKGMPLHTEYRVFIDCDTDKVIGVSPYWEPNTMKQRFGHAKDADSPHQMHDYVIYASHEKTLMNRYHENVDAVISHVQTILPELDLKGQWSLDVMQNGSDFWLIDMAPAETSYFYDCVPKELRRPSTEDWLPQLPY